MDRHPRGNSREAELLLGHGELVPADSGYVYPVRKSELRIQPNLRILGLKKFLDEELQHELGDFNAIQRDGVHVDIALPAGAVRVRDHVYIVYAAEDGKQRVRGAGAFPNTIKIHFRFSGDDSGFALQFH